jgi:hypothetical protein
MFETLSSSKSSKTTKKRPSKKIRKADAEADGSSDDGFVGGESFDHDFDHSHDAESVSRAVEVEQLQETGLMPKDGFKTSQFAVTLATTVIGALFAFLTAKGYVTAADAPELQSALIGVAVVGVAWINKKYIEGRNEVSVQKARSAANIAELRARNVYAGGAIAGTVEPVRLESAGPMGGPFSFFGGWEESAMLAIQFALLRIGNPKTGSKKAAVAKALRAALAALQEYKSGGETTE